LKNATVPVHGEVAAGGLANGKIAKVGCIRYVTLTCAVSVLAKPTTGTLMVGVGSWARAVPVHAEIAMSKDRIRIFTSGVDADPNGSIITLGN
jgi:hypothetical protein